MNNKKKMALMTALVLVTVMSVIMLSSCSVAYSGVYKGKTILFGVEVTLELGLLDKAVFTMGDATEEYIYKIDYKKKVVIFYDKDDKDQEIGHFEIVSRNELKPAGAFELIYSKEFKRDGILPKFLF
ncbi:MAG: hypothetical protein LBQ27_00980 [Clostridiales bacterium]|jgi:hypothetical protein|nr:hypothetical protein [Clostridiales bacterium]